MLLAGRMRDVVEFQALSTVQSNTGDPQNVWTPVRRCRASIEPLRGRELVMAQQAFSRVTTRFRCRYIDDINATMRIIPQTGPMAGKWFHVQFVQYMDGRRHEMVVMAEERPEMKP
jgi:SPP1 family predicted phage head-tail adaptor